MTRRESSPGQRVLLLVSIGGGPDHVETLHDVVADHRDLLSSWRPGQLLESFAGQLWKDHRERKAD